FTAFNARSLLPLKSMKRFSTQLEPPITTNRPWVPSLPVLYVPAAASVRGPFLFLGSAGSTAGDVRFTVAKLVGEESNSFSTVHLSGFLISSERENGNPVVSPFMPLTIG